jgi:[protein-PII] uridylyltransferase
MNPSNHPSLSKLKVDRKHLISGFLSNQEPNFLRKHATLMDAYFRHCYESSLVGLKINIIKNPYALIALGGYGRAEHCLHSDIDLLFLFNDAIPCETEELVREMVYPLWDLGFEVGQATRTLSDCVDIADRDIEVFTSLLDARFICGFSPLYSNLMQQIRQQIIDQHAKDLIQRLVERNQQRHDQFGDSAYLLEPNLKEGKGGLRDYHTMLWIGRIIHNLKTPRDLEYFGCLSHQEYVDLDNALNFTWHIRNHLHYLCGHKSDQLLFEYQIKLAERLNYHQQNGEQPVELFLGKLHGHMEVIKAQHNMFLYEQIYRRKRKQQAPQVIKNSSRQPTSIMVHQGVLNFESANHILNAPDLLITIFELSARRHIPLSAEAKRLIKEFRYLIDDDFRVSKTHIKSFENILMTPAKTFNVLNDMLQTGFLGEFIPEFQEISNRIQYDRYHLFPVDRHLLQTIQVLNSLGTAQDPTQDELAGRMYHELKSKRLLLWAALLHDIGKGNSQGNHSEIGASMAKHLLQKRGFKPKDIDIVVFLVQEHLLLFKVATRRDINDEQTVITLARQIKDIDRLKMLYLLSLSDSIATGPNAWNDWSFSLLRSLFFKTLNILEKGELASQKAIKIVNAKKTAFLNSVPAEERALCQDLVDAMSPRYLLYVPAEALPAHSKLYQKVGDNHFTWQIDKSSLKPTRTVTVCAKDHPGLFSKIAGTFTLIGVNIIDAQIFTWRNQMALDIFEVSPPPDPLFEQEKWQKAERQLLAAIKGELDLASELKKHMAVYRPRKPSPSKRPNRVVIDNQSSNFFTIIEIFTYDYTGLLFNVTNALAQCHLDIWVAKVATKADQVVDVFYVRDVDGQKVDREDQVKMIQETIEKVLEGSSSQPGKRQGGINSKAQDG